MIYEYQDIQTGEIVEISKHHSQCDPLGVVIEHEGRKVRRIASVKGTIQIGPEDNPRPRNNLPRNMPGCNCDSRGRPVITNVQGRKMGLVENPWLDIYKDD